MASSPGSTAGWAHFPDLPSPPAHLTWQWLSTAADSVSAVGHLFRAQVGRKACKMEHLLGALGPARETDPAPVARVSTDTRDSAPGNRLSTGRMVQRDGFLETETQAGLRSSRGSRLPKDTTSWR